MRLISGAALDGRPTMDSPEGTLDTSHFLQSSLREKLPEHVFIGELLRCLWRLGRRDIEVHLIHSLQRLESALRDHTEIGPRSFYARFIGLGVVEEMFGLHRGIP
jgi:hypothetical protein